VGSMQCVPQADKLLVGAHKQDVGRIFDSCAAEAARTLLARYYWRLP
jgi:hypothetical protein